MKVFPREDSHPYWLGKPGTEHSFHPFLKRKSSNESERTTYDAVGNVATKKDNRLITTSFTYMTR
jgi:hypothetical protein